MFAVLRVAGVAVADHVQELGEAGVWENMIWTWKWPEISMPAAISRMERKEN